MRARKIEKAKPAEEAAAGEKSPAGAGGGGEGSDGGACALRLVNADIAIAAYVWSALTPTAPWWDAKAKGARADGAAAPFVTTPVECALIPCLGDEGSDCRGSVRGGSGSETGIEPAGGAGIEVASGTRLLECAPAELFDFETGLSSGVDFDGKSGGRVCVVAEMTWPTGLGVGVVAICPVVLLTVW